MKIKITIRKTETIQRFSVSDIEEANTQLIEIIERSIVIKENYYPNFSNRLLNETWKNIVELHNDKDDE